MTPRADLGRQGLDERGERIARRFDLPVIVAALLVIPTIIIERSDLGPAWDLAAFLLNWGSWLVFAAEVVVMTAIASPGRRWLATHKWLFGHSGG